MYNTFEEVRTRLNDVTDGLAKVDATLVTPDGKRWKMSRLRFWLADDVLGDAVECELVEDKPGT